MSKTISKKKNNTVKLKFDTWQYAPAPESKSAASIKPQYDLFINGQWTKLALHYLVMLKETLGEDWMNNQWFRFGASSLANDVLMQIMKENTGVYQAANYFSVD